FRGESSPLTWLFTLTDRCFFDSLGEPMRVQHEQLDDFPLQPLEDFEDAFVSQDLIIRLLSRSDNEVRAIVVHRYFDELDLDTIADRLGLNERTVRRKLLRFLEGARKLAEADR